VAGPVVDKTFTLAPTSRRTVDVNSVAEGVGPSVLGHATHVASNVPILAERPLYFHRVIDQKDVNGATVAFGTSPSHTFNLGEGTVLPAFSEFLTLANPDPDNDASITLHYLLEGGQAPIDKTVNVPKGARRTVQVFDAADVGGIGRNVSDPVSRGVAVKITTTALRGVVVERPLYFDTVVNGLSVNDGTDKPGAAALANTWSFAEGTTLPDFATFFTVLNPNPTATTLTVTYLTDQGEVLARTATVGANSRLTIQVYNPAQQAQGALGLERTGFATTIVGSQPILVERPIYELHSFPDIAAPISGATDVVGLTGGD
jgi:hypothetical protein